MKSLLRLPQVQARVGLSRSEIYRLMKIGKFPQAVPLGERIVAWPSVLIDSFVEARIKAGDRTTPDNTQPAQM